MVAYNFQGQFTDLILSGRKQSTIRPRGKRRHAVAGEPLQLYVGQRTPACCLLMRVPCQWSRLVTLAADHVAIHRGSDGDDIETLSGADREALARDEGFENYHLMQAWFEGRYGLPVVGFVQIRWNVKAATFVAQSATKGAA